MFDRTLPAFNNLLAVIAITGSLSAPWISYQIYIDNIDFVRYKIILADSYCMLQNKKKNSMSKNVSVGCLRNIKHTVFKKTSWDNFEIILNQLNLYFQAVNKADQATTFNIQTLSFLCVVCNGLGLSRVATVKLLRDSGFILNL